MSHTQIQTEEVLPQNIIGGNFIWRKVWGFFFYLQSRRVHLMPLGQKWKTSSTFLLRTTNTKIISLPTSKKVWNQSPLFRLVSCNWGLVRSFSSYTQKQNNLRTHNKNLSSRWKGLTNPLMDAERWVSRFTEAWNETTFNTKWGQTLHRDIVDGPGQKTWWHQCWNETLSLISPTRLEIWPLPMRGWNGFSRGDKRGAYKCDIDTKNGCNFDRL